MLVVSSRFQSQLLCAVCMCTCIYRGDHHHNTDQVRARYTREPSIIYMYRFELPQHVVPFVCYKVGDHGSTLSSIKHILLGLVLERRAENVIAHLYVMY